MSRSLQKNSHCFFIFILIPGCGGAEYARNNGIPVILFPKAKDESDGLSPSDLVDALRSNASLFYFFQMHLTLEFSILMNQMCGLFYFKVKMQILKKNLQ